MQSPYQSHTFNPLAGIMEEYVPTAFDQYLIEAIVQVLINPSEFNLSKSDIRDSFRFGAEYNSLREEGYFSPDDPIDRVVDIIYDLANYRRVIPPQYQTVTLIYRYDAGHGITSEQRVTLTPENKEYFTVRDIAQGIIQFYESFKDALRKYCGRVSDRFDVFTVQGVDMLDSEGTNIYLLVTIDGLYNQ